jgi:hypothetical protein
MALGRQPGGFESFPPLLIQAEALDLTVSDREGPDDAGRDLHSVSAGEEGRPRNDDVRPDLDELPRLDLNRGPTTDEVLEDPAGLIQYRPGRERGKRKVSRRSKSLGCPPERRDPPKEAAARVVRRPGPLAQLVEQETALLDRLAPDWREHLVRASPGPGQLVGVVTQAVSLG